ncbi:MAG: hypothetical protein KDA70_11850 [Planctomycetaceae bacterium]|nr:hypothetical protein [Planctomycetaceae bacterium]MCA9019507.1 hypothetical protein [Planctomycetaceae bacterium]
MMEYYRQIVTAQFEAALGMLNECVLHCPADHWHEKIANMEFGYVPYHTLCYVDLYLSPNLAAFELRPFHNEHDENRFKPKADHPITQTLVTDYLQICLKKMRETIAVETEETLKRKADFDWLEDFSRGELHLYSIRHIQHHTGALSASLRRLKINLKWGHTGWPAPTD